MEKLLRFVEEPDVGLFDNVVAAFYQGTPQQREMAHKVLTTLQEHPQFWTRVDTILEYSQSEASKFYALQNLESLVKYRWKIVPREQTVAIKNYIVQLILKLSSSEEMMQANRLFLQKLNICLVQIIKQEWPRQWETLIPEIVHSSQTSDSVCENNMAILKLLSEEIFDFSSGQMTQAKIAELKNQFNKEFSLIYKLCEAILENSQRPSLVYATLDTLLRFLTWIPLGYIFETKLIDMLVYKFLPVGFFRNVTLKCLTEIGSLQVGSVHDLHFAKLYCLVITQLRMILPLETDIASAYGTGTLDAQKFVQDLALFFTSFFKAHLQIAEKPEYQPFCLEGHMYLSQISLVPEVEIFKICLEYWNILAADLYNETPFLNLHNSSPRRTMYAPILSKVRLAMIARMPKPEEVLVVEDDSGGVVREVAKDVDAIQLYKSMKETLVYLTHLDPEDTQAIMLEKLQRQVNGTEWSWHNLNTLCWAIGSISGAMTEEDEKKFLVTVIKDLLGLCEMKRGKDNKAVIASNIMYVVGQYPRFLRAHWKFLKTVVNKLFEFMHERHPGVQDMAVETFLKIAQKCRRKFVVVQVGETQPFIDEILQSLPTIIADLEPNQIHIFYEATACMISSHTTPMARDALTFKLMELPNQTWMEMMQQAARNVDYLRSADTAKSIVNILKTNIRACTSLGHFCITFPRNLGRIFVELLNVYKFYSETISAQVAAGGPQMSQTAIIKAYRAVKKDTLRLFITFIERTEDVHTTYTTFIPSLLEAVLGDYKIIIPETRDAEVLQLLTIIISKIKTPMTPDVPRILDHVFETTLGMIQNNFDDYPDHRVHFFSLLRAINQYCFGAFFMIPQPHFKLVVDSIVWAFKHPDRNIGEIGLLLLLEFWKSSKIDEWALTRADISQQPEVAQAFYQAFLLPILNDLFVVLTDTFHKSNFKLHATSILTIIHAVETGQVAAPLWDPTKVPDPTMTNQRFLREYIMGLLASSFKHLAPAQIQLFVMKLFDACRDLPAFKNHLRDFLVQLKEFQGDNADLYLEEQEAQAQLQRDADLKRRQQIPGMIAPHDQPGFDLDMS